MSDLEEKQSKFDIEKPLYDWVKTDARKLKASDFKTAYAKKRATERVKAKRAAQRAVNEDGGAAPANCAGSGAVAGIGVGPNGEPGRKKKSKQTFSMFKRKLTELFDTDTPVQHHQLNDYQHMYITGKHAVSIHHPTDHHATVDFINKTGDMHMTGEHKHDAHRVMAGVQKAIKTHIDNHPHIKTIEFSAHKKDQGRVKLYRHLAKKHGEVEEKENKFSHRFKVHLHGR